MKEQQEAEARAKFGDELITCTVGGVELVFHTPDQASYEEYQSKMQVAAEKKNMGAVTREFCLRCLVHPTTEDLARAFERKPGAPIVIAGKLAQLAGADIETSIKKG